MGLIRRPLLRAARTNLSPFQPRRRAGDVAAPEPPAPHPHRLARLRLTTVRVVTVTLLMLGVAVVAGNVFDGIEWSLFLPVLAAAGAVWAALRLPSRVPALGRVTFTLVVVVAAATAVAVLAGGSVADVIPRLVDGPRRLLTTEWPSPPDPTVLATVALLLGGATALAVDLARRPDLHLAPLAPVLVALVTLVALSAPHRPAWWVLAGLAGLTLVLALANHGERAGARVATLRGERALVVTVAMVIAATLAAAAAIAWGSGRADPRQVADASRSSTIVRSLESTVGLREAKPPVEQFTVTDESPLIGQRMPTRWRVAALDQYDGQRWVPQVEVRPIGNRLAPDEPARAESPQTGRYRLDLLAPHTELVPLPGPPVAVTGDPMPRIQTDLNRVIVQLTESAPAGTTLGLVAELAPTADAVTPAAIVVHEVNEIEAVFTEAATDLAGNGEALSRLQRLEQELRGWQLDRRAPGAGQQLKLLEQFVNDTRRGTDEQFVSAFVLLARSLGFEARVATGFVVEPDRATSPMTVTSSDAAAWPEVHVADAGWLAFDPVPDDEVGDVVPPEPEPETQTPAAAQPPAEPPARPGETDTETDEEAEETEARWGSVATWVVRVLLGSALIAIPAALALAAIVVVKQARRRRRATADEPAAQVRGAWANATDALVDAGLTIEPSWTDDRIAAMGAPLVGPAPHELRRLATLSTWATFGPTPEAAIAADATETERRLRVAMASQLTRWQRLRWQLSLRSLRRPTKSPVSA